MAVLEETRFLMDKYNVHPNKNLGQNFLIDSNVCPAMAKASCDYKTGVLEIGPGVGVLTKELSKVAKKVVAIELDERLKKVLPITLSECNNVEVIYGDVMKLDLKNIIEEYFSDCESVSVCANLPYYITSPIILMLLEEKLPIKTITVMVQLESAERLCADVGTRNAGAVTVAVNYFAESEILFKVSRESFLPSPNVDSAVIQLKIRKNPHINIMDEKKFFSLTKACFAQRRKTLVNTVSNTLGIDKIFLKELLLKMGLSETVRGEELTIEQLAQLSNLL